MRFTGSKIFIRLLEESDAESLLDLELRNKEFFQKYSPTFDENFFTLDSRLKFLSDAANKMEKGEAYAFGIFAKDSGKLVGTISVFSIVRGALQKCMIGYSLDKQYNGNGYTTEAVSLAVAFAFDELKLHRVEAGVMPSNIGSMRVLEKAGFHKEGIEQKGVKINGQWEDHQIFAIISDKN